MCHSQDRVGNYHHQHRDIYDPFPKGTQWEKEHQDIPGDSDAPKRQGYFQVVHATYVGRGVLGIAQRPKRILFSHTTHVGHTQFQKITVNASFQYALYPHG